MRKGKMKKRSEYDIFYNISVAERIILMFYLLPRRLQDKLISEIILEDK